MYLHHSHLKWILLKKKNSHVADDFQNCSSSGDVFSVRLLGYLPLCLTKSKNVTSAEPFPRKFVYRTSLLQKLSYINSKSRCRNVKLFFILFLFVLLCHEVELMHVSTFYLPMLKKSFLFLAVQRNQFCLRSFVKPRKTRNLWPSWNTGSEGRRWRRVRWVKYDPSVNVSQINRILI